MERYTGNDRDRFFYLDELFDFSKYVIYFDGLSDDLLKQIVHGLKIEADRRHLVLPEFAPAKPVVNILAALTMNEKACIETGRKIFAIKFIRQRLGCGLKDAKDHADAYEKAWKEAGSPAGGIGPDAENMA